MEIDGFDTEEHDAEEASYGGEYGQSTSALDRMATNRREKEDELCQQK